MKFGQGFEIVVEIGKITTEEGAQRVLRDNLDDEHHQRISHFKNPNVLKIIANAIVMCQPDTVRINTGSKHDKQFVRDLSLQKEEEAPLAMEGHTIHYDFKQEQGRIIDLTDYIANDDNPVSSLGLRMSRNLVLEAVRKGMTGIMQGKTMIVGFYSRGPVGAKVSNPVIEITSSAYVSHSAESLFRNIYADFEKEVERAGHCYTSIHSEGHDRLEDLTNDRMTLDTGDAPSDCSKTTTAMAGNYFAGDDLAQMWIAKDGTVRSFIPENGIFGIVEDINLERDPMLMKRLRLPCAETINSIVMCGRNQNPNNTNSIKKTSLKTRIWGNLVNRFLNNIDKFCVLTGFFASARYIYSSYIDETPILLGQMINVFFSACLVPIGILFILCPFNSDLLRVAVKNKNCVAVAGLAILYASVMGLS